MSGSPNFTSAIGSIKATDVTLISIESDSLPGPDGVVVADTSVLPAGLSALWSFAELFKIAAAAELDVNPVELQVGLHPFPKGVSETRRIFIADSLENGAGYAARLAHPEIVNAIMQNILTEILPTYEARRHTMQCDASCPDCLRSYDNRQLHSVLDWRLRSISRKLRSGVEPDLTRWLSNAEAAADQLVKNFRNESMHLSVKRVGSLIGVYSSDGGRIVIFSHPLWRKEQPLWTPQQSGARDSLSARLIQERRFASSISITTVAILIMPLFGWRAALRVRGCLVADDRDLSVRKIAQSDAWRTK